MSAFPPAWLGAQLVRLGCEVARVKESFVHSGGAGGQNVNKVATCVVLRYEPRHLVVKMQEHRTQAMNRMAAWKLLAAQLEEQAAREAREKRAARELKRRQNAPRPAGIKRQFVELKRRRARTRSARGAVGAED